jgi:hypothetical protein
VDFEENPMLAKGAPKSRDKGKDKGRDRDREMGGGVATSPSAQPKGAASPKTPKGADGKKLTKKVRRRWGQGGSRDPIHAFEGVCTAKQTGRTPGGDGQGIPDNGQKLPRTPPCNRRGKNACDDVWV